ncbi:MAG: plastocyanin/azurin family copper-binding protein [Balneolales bacterium]
MNILTRDSRAFKLSTSFIFVLILTVGMIGCDDTTTGPGGNHDNNGDNGNDEPAGTEVFMQGQSFNPSNLTVEPGTTVTWTNTSNLVHTVTSGSNREHDGQFDSGNIAPDEFYEYTFEETGTYDYYCRPHVGMSGTITVEESND